MDLSLKHQTIVIAPLSWGLGHASRCIPIIDKLRRSNEVHIATDGGAYDLLSAEFPALPIHRLTSYDISYKHNSMLLNMGFQAVKIWKAIKAEHQEAQFIAKKVDADIIISDNRLAFRSTDTHNIYLTHQLRVLASNALTTYFATKIHQSYYNKFDSIWIPDYAGNDALAPKLSALPIDKPVKYLGPISRFKTNSTLRPEHKYDLAVILSGPEPQRSYLEKCVLSSAAADMNKSIVLVRGTRTAESITVPEHIKLFDLITTEKLCAIIDDSANLLCRSGYSSVMDLVSIDRGATLVPTPGQYEQEYLAKALDGKYGFTSMKQSAIREDFKI